MFKFRHVFVARLRRSRILRQWPHVLTFVLAATPNRDQSSACRLPSEFPPVMLCARRNTSGPRLALSLPQHAVGRKKSHDQRLYIDAVEDVLSRSNKVILDANSSGNMIYLPVDKILENRSALPAVSGTGSARPVTPTTPPEPAAEIEAAPSRSREELRNRGAR